MENLFLFFFLGLKRANPSPRKWPHSDSAALVFLSAGRCVAWREAALLPATPILWVCECVSVLNVLCCTLVSCQAATRLRGEMREGRASAAAAARLLPLLCCAYATAGYIFTPQELDVTPRVTVTSSGEPRRPQTTHIRIRNAFNSAIRDAPARLRSRGLMTDLSVDGGR